MWKKKACDRYHIQMCDLEQNQPLVTVKNDIMYKNSFSYAIIDIITKLWKFDDWNFV